ncbi:MAG TPA: tyrosine-type recombinase/integrase [Anaerolineae bacterium]
MAEHVSITVHNANPVPDERAKREVFTAYRMKRAANTINRQQSDLARFAEYLAPIHATTTADELATNPEAWRGMTRDLVAGFVQWQLRTGFAVASCNVRLSTVRTYARLAMQVGMIDLTEFNAIKAVTGYNAKEQKRIDISRDIKRVGAKKAEAVTLTEAHVRSLELNHPDTAQGRRNRLMMCLLLNLGLRVSEVISLRACDFDLQAGTVTFFRSRIGLTQTHQLTSALWDAARAYIGQDVTDPQAPLLRASIKGGKLAHNGLTRFGVAKRVQALGRRIGVENLSPFDLRHSWAVRAARNKTDAFALRDAGGWSSMAVPGRYVEAAKVANEGIILSESPDAA